MRELTYKQHKILELFRGEKEIGFNNEDLTDNHWELVRKGYVKNLVSLGIYSWKFILTQEGIEYLYKNCEEE